MAQIGSLTADLKLESAAFIRDMTRAAQATQKNTAAMQKSMAGLQRSFASAGSSLKGFVAGFISVAGIRAFVNLAKSATEFADSIGDVSAALGISADALQRYRVAGEQADVSIGSMDAALTLFQKNLASGKVKDASFDTFIQRIREAPTHIEKIKVAQQGLKKQFQTGILLASMSAEEFRKFYSGAATISQKALDNADVLTKQWGRLQDVVAKGFAEGFLKGFTGELTLSQESLDDFKEAAEGLGALSSKIVTWIGTIASSFTSLATKIPEATNSLRDYIIKLREANLERMSPKGRAAAELFPPLRAPTPNIETFGASQGGRRGGLPVAQEAAAAAAAEAEATRAVIAADEAAAGAKARLAEATRLANEEQQKTTSLIESTRTPYEEYIATLNEVAATQIKTGEAAEAAGRMQQMAAAQAIQPWLGVADTLAGALGTMFKENKAVAIAQAVINTAQAIAATIAQYGFTPIGIAAAAAAAAMGAAQIATIRSSKPGGGGSVRAPAASRGSGRAASRDGDGRGAQDRAVFINLKGSSGFTSEQVEGLIGQLIDAQKDGARLVLGKQ